MSRSQQKITKHTKKPGNGLFAGKENLTEMADLNRKKKESANLKIKAIEIIQSG